MESFETPRLLLRPLAAEDEALYCALYTDPGVMVHIGAPLSPEAARRGFAEACRRNGDPDRGERRWTVLDRVSGQALGLLAVIRDARAAADVELGVMLLAAAHGRGLARELNATVVRQAFGPGGWGLQRVWARHAPGHAAAAATLAASGFAPAPSRGAGATMAIDRERWQATGGG